MQFRDATCYYKYRALQIITQLSITLQYGITIIFWIFVAPEFLPSATFAWRVGLIGSHVVPIIFVLINFFSTSEVQMEFGDWWHTLVLTVAYTAVNFTFTKKTDEPVYPFMTWERGMHTPFYSVATWMVSLLLYQVTNHAHKRLFNKQVLA